MTCPDERLAEWLLEALPEHDQAKLAGHVRDCAACAGEVEDLRKLEDRLRRLPAASARPRRKWTQVAGPAVAVAVLLVIVGVILTRPERTGPLAGRQGIREDARELTRRFEQLGATIRAIIKGPNSEPKRLLNDLDAIRPLAEKIERDHPSEAKGIRDQLRTIRASCRVVEMLTWTFPEARKRFEDTRKEFTEDEWKEIAEIYLGANRAPRELESLTTTFFRRGRDAAADLADDPSPGVEVRLVVKNDLKDRNRRWDNALFQITWPKGADSGEVLFEYDARKKTGKVKAGILRSHVAELRDRGLLTLHDAAKCGCAAPQHMLSAKVGENANSLYLGHPHTDQDYPQWELVEAVMRFVDHHAKE